MALHEVQLKGYSVRPGNLSLGTFDSYGIEQLHVTLDDTWSGLAVTATFNPPEGEPVEIRVPENGLIDVPAEATANAGTGTVVYCGVANGVQRITKTQGYNVFTHGNVGTTVPFNPSESLATQVLQAALNAEKNSAEAKTAAASAVIAAANSAAAAKSSENAAANSAAAAKVSENAAATSEDNAKISAGAAAVSEGNASASADKASASETAAAESEKAAAASAVAAAGSAAQAETQKTAAAKSASDAQGYMQTASGAATAANASAENAAVSKAAAASSATAAEESKQAAVASEVKVAESEQAAKASEWAAAKSAQAALESKMAAATSEGNAAASAKKAQDVADSLPADYTAMSGDVSTLKNQMQLAYPDDSTIGENPWSSKNIVDMLCPPLEESGNPVVCYPVAGYPLGVTASWKPVQEGEGKPSPENIRPIKGRDSVMVERCGENLLNIKLLRTSRKNNGITWTINDNGSISVSGNSNNTSYLGDAVQKLNKSKMMLLPPGTYYFGGRGAAAVIYFYGFYDDGTIFENPIYTNTTRKIERNVYLTIQGNIKSGTSVNETVYPFVIPGSTAPTTYEPYIGQTNTLTLPETVYGGEVDAARGEGQETWKILTLNGHENLDTANSVGTAGMYVFLREMYNVANVVCTHFKKVDILFSSDSNDAERKNTFAWMDSYSPRFVIAHELIGTTKNSTVEECVYAIKAYFAAQYAAGTPVQLCYKLAEPVPFTATGAQPLPALAGLNTVLTDADSVTVTGRADPIKRITDLEDAVASQT